MQVCNSRFLPPDTLQFFFFEVSIFINFSIGVDLFQRLDLFVTVQIASISYFKCFSNLDWIKSDIASDSDYWDAPCSHHVGDSPLGYSNVICDLFTVQTAWR